MNPLENDEIYENAKAIANLNSLELNTMKSGSCDKFVTLFERRITEVIQAAPDQSVIYTDRYKKMLLLGKIMHKDYASMKVKSKTQLSYREYVQELQSFAASVESKSSDTPAEKKRLRSTK